MDENPVEYKSRIRSLWFVHASMGTFVMAYMVMTPGLYGYMKEVGHGMPTNLE